MQTTDNGDSLEAYFLPSYPCLRTFFSLYEDSTQAVLLLNEYSRALPALFSRHVQLNARVLTVPEFPVDWRHLLSLPRIRRWQRRWLERLGDCTRATYFCDAYTVNFFLILDALRRRGCELRFINSEPWNEYERPTNVRANIKRFVLGTLYGLSIAPTHLQWWDTYRYLGPAPTEVPELLSWPEIRQRWLPAMSAQVVERAALLIDAPLHSLPGLDVDASRDLAAQRLRALLADGWTLYVKPHPAHSRHSFSGTPLAAQITELDAAVPAEMLTGLFGKVLSFGSSGRHAFGDDVELLADCLLFHSPEARADYLRIVDRINETMPGVANCQDEQPVEA